MPEYIEIKKDEKQNKSIEKNDYIKKSYLRKIAMLETADMMRRSVDDASD